MNFHLAVVFNLPLADAAAFADVVASHYRRLRCLYVFGRIRSAVVSVANVTSLKVTAKEVHSLPAAPYMEVQLRRIFQSQWVH